MTISSCFSILNFYCNCFFDKDYLLTIILIHIITVLYFVIFKGSEIMTSSIFFRENFRYKVIINFSFTNRF